MGVLAIIVALFAFLLSGKNLGILAPAGTIASQQRELIIWTCLLSLLVVLPVFAMTFYIIWKYRASNKKAKYNPEMHTSVFAEVLWWVVPLILITILAVITWVSTHKLDPYRPIESNVKPVTIQVVALNWKWLFIYPEQRIATVNYLRFPVDTPINFQLTADAPMNSFWIPQLGGQVYTMAGMQTKLHLMADKLGTYRGSSANLSGEGFSGMKFDATATSREDFDVWVESVKQSGKPLTQAAYKQLAEPSKDVPMATYSPYDTTLYDTILMKYMMPGHGTTPQKADTIEPMHHEAMGH